MGGIGSTRWGDHLKATTVEACAKIAVTTFERAGLLKPITSAGTLALGHGAEADFVIAPEGQDARLMALQRELRTWRGTPFTHEQVIHLHFRRQRRGRARWRFRCPIRVDGKPCGRRCAILYLPPEADDFGCRSCHGLTYLSSQARGQAWTQYRRMVREIEEAGISAAEVGLDMPMHETVAVLREMIEGR